VDRNEEAPSDKATVRSPDIFAAPGTAGEPVQRGSSRASHSYFAAGRFIYTGCSRSDAAGTSTLPLGQGAASGRHSETDAAPKAIQP